MALYGKKLRTSENIIEQLELLDILCEEKGLELELVVIGGAGILLLLESQNRTFRSTRDIDVQLISANNENHIHELLKKTQIEIVGGVLELPPMEDFIDGEKYKIESDFNTIQVFVPSLELLACSKIFSKREKDLMDLKETELLDECDIPKLIDMVEEYKFYLLNPIDPDMNMHQLVNILDEKLYNKN